VKVIIGTSDNKLFKLKNQQRRTKMDNLQALIDGRALLHKSAHIDTKGHFKEREYKEIKPN
jgi:hypothetical protein